MARSRKVEIDLEELAKECGVEVSECDREWGGRYAYSDQPNVRYCGYRTRKAALKGWFRHSVQGKLGEVLLRDHIRVK